MNNSPMAPIEPTHILRPEGGLIPVLPGDMIPFQPDNCSYLPDPSPEETAP